MAIDERGRHQLYQKLEEVLGTDEATVLMEHLPPVGWADVATKSDLEHLRSDVRADLSELKAELTHRMTTLVLTGMIGVGGLAFAAARLV